MAPAAPPPATAIAAPAAGAPPPSTSFDAEAATAAFGKQNALWLEELWIKARHAAERAAVVAPLEARHTVELAQLKARQMAALCEP